MLKHKLQNLVYVELDYLPCTINPVTGYFVLLTFFIGVNLSYIDFKEHFKCLLQPCHHSPPYSKSIQGQRQRVMLSQCKSILHVITITTPTLQHLHCDAGIAGQVIFLNNKCMVHCLRHVSFDPGLDLLPFSTLVFRKSALLERLSRRTTGTILKSCP